MAERTPRLQAYLDRLQRRWDIPQSFVDASDHKYTCTCAACAEWWRAMGPDPDTGEYGPFGAELPPADAGS